VHLCGVFRGRCNRKAREIGADKLATGHNLDDEAQAVMLNVMNGDTERLARLRPTRAQEGLIPRIKPLMDIPEREIALYAFLKKIPFYMGECPYTSECCAARSRTCSTTSSTGTRARSTLS
jgi:tRNA(Ile)-lysidine synthase TilS/MesJ